MKQTYIVLGLERVHSVLKVSIVNIGHEGALIEKIENRITKPVNATEIFVDYADATKWFVGKKFNVEIEDANG